MPAASGGAAQTSTLRQAQAQARSRHEPAWIEELREAVGPGEFLTGFADRLAYARDRMPLTSYLLREGFMPGDLPSAVAIPADEDSLVRLVTIANHHRLPMVPFGAGSGVLGGAVPLSEGMTIDLKALCRIIELNETNNTVTVEAGMNGGVFEAFLNEHGYTCGHVPQSITMSTVGGWAACRGGGQFSSRFGKIEDMVIGLRAVLPNGELMVIEPAARRAVGPSLKDLLVGSEGVFGFITGLTMRIWPLPEKEIETVVAFPDHEAGLAALAEIMQAEIRPTMARLYDATESASRAGGLAGFGEGNVLCMMIFSGRSPLAEAEHRLAGEIAEKHGARALPSDPIAHWRKVRFQSYSNEYMFDGCFMDTIEITGGWDVLPEMYRRMENAIRALHPDAYFGAHWSHVYPEGACQYMTFRFPPMPIKEGRELHARAWDVVLSHCLELRGSISHHHGSGYWRNPWLKRELGPGVGIMQAIKDMVDPAGLVNRGKLALD